MSSDNTPAEATEPAPTAYNAAGLPLPCIVCLKRDPIFLKRWQSYVKKPRRGIKTSCWEWTGAKDEKGYGRIKVQYRCIAAHRLAFGLAHNRWPDPALMALHSCDNPACVNPAHLREGTAKENQDDIDRRGRRNPNRTPRSKPPGVDHWRGGTPSDAMLRGGSKLTEDDVRTIRARYTEPDDALALALDYNCTAQTIIAIATKQRFRWVHGVNPI